MNLDDLLEEFKDEHPGGGGKATKGGAVPQTGKQQQQ
jgi:hypothetical protein